MPPVEILIEGLTQSCIYMTMAFGLVREWHNHLLEMPVETSNGLGSRPLLELLGATSQAGDLRFD